MFHKLGLYYRTIKHLKPIQIRYRLWYILRDKFRKLTGYTYTLSIPKEGYPLSLVKGCPSSAVCRLPSKTFTFLNQSHTFEGAIDWNFSKYGKLWAYNLNYFDFLQQPGITKEEGLELITDFIDQIDTNEEGLEPYPISLRGINWIKFLSKNGIKDKKIDSSLFAQYQILLDNLEYHLLGNHLMENGCSLLFGAYYFQDQELYRKAKEILSNELEEQVLEDGGHFERSTMYHSILLERLLDCYNMVINNGGFNGDELEEKLKEKIRLMLGWLGQLTVESDQDSDNRSRVAQSRFPASGLRPPASSQLPLLNDAAKGIGPEPSELFKYAKRLGVQPEEIKLSESGYRRYSTDKLELICDVGDIGPDYIPGHAHCDTFSFVLYSEGKPVIIDPGVSTYENNEQRHLERSTQFHNTVQLGDLEQSEIWSAFRVGDRAKVSDVTEERKNSTDILHASHDGYLKQDIIHQRIWKIDYKVNEITIKDELAGKTGRFGFLNLHFHPYWQGEIKQEGNKIQIGNLQIAFQGDVIVKKQFYNCPDGYNQYIKGNKITVRFVENITTTIALTHENPVSYG